MAPYSTHQSGCSEIRENIAAHGFGWGVHGRLPGKDKLKLGLEIVGTI